MIALDTNVLVRLLTCDDQQQAEVVRVLVEQHADKDAAFFVSDVVLAELAWTLERAYGHGRQALEQAFQALADDATFEFESRELLRASLALFRTTRAGLSDCLIAARAQAVQCDELVTFDKAMSALPGVRLL